MKERFLPLDGLRGLAIALVVWFHLWQMTWLRADLPLPGTPNLNWIPETGFLGVDLFFFLSGCCLFEPYARAFVRGEEGPDVRTFAYRRALKIVPSYLLVLVALSLLDPGQFTSLADAARQLALHLAFVHNWFPDSYGSVNGVLWSIAVEVQFYVLFPAIARFARRAPLCTFGGLAVIALVWRAVVRDAYDVTHLVNQLPGVLDLFAAGMAVAYAHHALAVRRPPLAARRSLWTALSLAGIGAAVVVMQTGFAARTGHDWPFYWLAESRAFFALALAATTLGALFAVPRWQRALGNPLLVALAAVSYNLYLWHQAVARALAQWHAPGWTGVATHDPAGGLLFTAVAGAAALAIAGAVTFALERPLLRRRPFEPPPRAARQSAEAVLAGASG